MFMKEARAMGLRNTSTPFFSVFPFFVYLNKLFDGARGKVEWGNTSSKPCV